MEFLASMCGLLYMTKTNSTFILYNRASKSTRHWEFTANTSFRFILVVPSATFSGDKPSFRGCTPLLKHGVDCERVVKLVLEVLEVIAFVYSTQ